MTTSDFTATIAVDQTPKEAFTAINNVRRWWSEEIVGETDKLNEVFNYHFEDIHRCRIKVSMNVLMFVQMVGPIMYVKVCSV